MTKKTHRISLVGQDEAPGKTGLAGDAGDIEKGTQGLSDSMIIKDDLLNLNFYNHTSNAA